MEQLQKLIGKLSGTIAIQEQNRENDFPDIKTKPFDTPFGPYPDNFFSRTA